MAFCPKCGSHLVESARFCPKCGAPAARPAAQSPAPTPILSSRSTTPSLTATLRGNLDKAFAVVGIVLALLSLLPWLQVGLLGFNMSYSIVGLPGDLGQLTNLATSSYLSYTSMSEIQAATNIVWALVAVWAIVVLLLAVNAVKAFRGHGSFPAAFLAMGIFAVAIIVAMFVLDGYVASQVSSMMGSYSSLSTSGMISATPWAWITAICSIGAFIAYLRLKRA